MRLFGWLRRAPDLAWKPSGIRYTQGKTADESLVKSANQRRERADRLKVESAKIASGAEPERKIHLIERTH